jgi:N-carbamoyl-L-amino-acid hydrolase
LGSGALVGQFNPDWLTQTDANGISMRDAMKKAGLNENEIPNIQRMPADYVGFVEVHIEQGPVLNELNLPLGVVSSINGSVRYVCEMVGMASHAGTTPMDRRRDAACAVAELALYMENALLQTAIPWPPLANCKCPTVQSMWCQANARSPWTCAHPKILSATP